MIWFGTALAATPAVVGEMHDRFDALTAARDAVIRGDLERARAEARWLQDLGTESRVPRPFRPFLVDVHLAAERIATADDLATAAKGVADVAQSCAGCHGDAGGGPKRGPLDDGPPPAWASGQNMSLHRWALDWMWTGLLAGDDDAWHRGADELASQPLAYRWSPDRVRREGDPPGLAPLEQLVYVVAGRAAVAETQEARTEAMAELLPLCTQCHLVARPPVGSAP